MPRTKSGILTYAGFTYTRTGIFANNVFPFYGLSYIVYRTPLSETATTKQKSHETSETESNVEASAVYEHEAEGSEEAVEAHRLEFEARSRQAEKDQTEVIERGQREFEGQKEAARETQASYAAMHAENVEKLTNAHTDKVKLSKESKDKEKGPSLPSLALTPTTTTTPTTPTTPTPIPTAADLCELFGVQTLSIFDGGMYTYT
jgi:hypothetical protein